MKKIIAISLLMAIPFASQAFAEREFKFADKDDFDAAKVSSLTVDMSGGDIELVKSKSDRIEVEYKKVIFADSREDADDINADCSFTTDLVGDKLEITVEVPGYRHRKSIMKRLLSGDWDDNISTYLRISVPDGKNIEIRSSSADIDVADLRLELDVRASSSDIKAKNTEGNFTFDLSSGDVDVYSHKGDVRIKGNSSDLDFESIDGNVDTRTSSGDGNFKGITGSVFIYTSSGDYKLYDIGGDLDIKTSSGDVYTNGVSGSVRAESSSGDIRMNELSASNGDFDVESNSGDVSLEITGNFEGRISLKSSSGTINSGLSGNIEYLTDSRVQGSVGNGEGIIRVSTSSGDIRIFRY